MGGELAFRALVAAAATERFGDRQDRAQGISGAWYRRRPPPEGIGRSFDTEQEAAENQARGIEVWRWRRPLKGSLGEAYFRARGFMPDMALYPGSDGWMETVCWSDDVFRLPKPPADPGVVFAVNDARTGLVAAVHRIPFRRGRPVKRADGKTLKISLGPIVGNAFRGSCQPDPYGRWGVAEGCETALAATQLVRFPVWGAISAGNMARVIPPGWVRHAVIFADNDENEVGIDAAAEALAALRRLPQLESVRVVMACEMGADANDVLRAVPYA